MQPNWDLIAVIASPIIAAFIGAALNEFLQRRPKLIVHWGHVSAFKSHPTGGSPIDVHTHSLIIRNEGKKSANNVRVSHQYLPDFSVYPPVQYEIKPLPNEGSEILFPILRPKEEITISYLYSPTITVDQIFYSVNSDEGEAKSIAVWLAPVLSRTFKLIIYYFFIVGLISTIYLITYFALKLL
ncbi:MAG: hypothetical protein IID12_07340 [Candidatus Marinimicrobia bacterium]|nr:hypothetical protein [Candidatus Neomarinimicrobiota bacterium]